jgi:hypothetical protein
MLRDRWQRLAAGLYYCETGAVPWTALAWGGVLLGGDSARLGGAAAAYLHGLLAPPPEVIDVLVTHGTRRVSRGPWQFVQERRSIRGPSHGAPPRLSIEDCVLDVCAAGVTREIVDLVSGAIQQRMTTADRLRRRLESRPRQPRRAFLEQLLAEVDEGAESPLELNYLREVERPHGLPAGTRQHRSRGTVRDVHYKQFGTVVELDGARGHQGRGRHRDMRRDNHSTRAGEATLRYGWWDVVESPCLVAAEVAVVLQLRGWSGLIRLCPACEPMRKAWSGSSRV